MRKQNGQALVEFIILIPVFMMIVLGIFDFGNIMYRKYQLEYELDYASEQHRNGETNDLVAYLKKQGLQMDISKNGDKITLTLSKQVAVITPGLNRIFGNPYIIQVERVLYEE